MFDGLSGELLKYEIGKFLLGGAIALVLCAAIFIWFLGGESIYRFKEWLRSRGR